MKGNGVGRFVMLLAILVVAIFGLSALAPLGNSPVANAAGASTSPTAAATPAASTSSATPATDVTTTTSSTPASSGAGPHPGTLEIYEVAPGGAPTVDPAVAYYTVDDEPISNVYETLISFNGTDTGPTPDQWVPEIATCVPGSVECSAQTGESLVFDNATTHQPQYYTFEISAGAMFYDPATKVSWNVYPSDVLFSFARTLQFANLPAVGYNNGWIQAQYLLPTVSTTWDGGIHTPYNNTPGNVLSSILVNDSAYCPASSLPTNGCVTFDVGASGEAWPYFLELVSDPLGGSIEPCGVFTALGAGLPGFPGTTAAKGDGPCLLPGNATSSTQSAYKNFVSTASPTLWDAVQELAVSNPSSPQPQVQYTMVGSGPYYAVSVTATGLYGSGGYTLAANPAYNQPAGCVGQPNCLPAPGDYVKNVIVYWDNDDTEGLQQAIAGQADGFGYDQAHTSTVLDLVHSGTYGLMTNVTTGNNWNMMFELTFNTTNEGLVDPNGPGATNVPGDFLANLGLRQFLVHAYPYATVQSTILSVDGVAYGENYGGAIPPGQTTYYPTNISWPGCGGLPSCSDAVGNPQTNPAVVGGAASWWQNITNPSSPWYDSELAACTPSSPCTFAIQGWVGAPSLDASMEAWIASVKALTGGAIQMYYFDITGSELYTQVSLGNGQGSLPVYNWGWVPDYNDPTDYMVPFWLPNGTFSFAQGLYSTFAEAQYNDVSACGHDSNSWQDLVYWANYEPDVSPLGIPSECQGIAYSTLVAWEALAAHETNNTYRILEFNLIEHIGNELAFEVYDYTTVATFTYGTWISPSGINLNPSVGGGGVQTWYTWVYATNVFNVSLSESTLPTGTTFSASLDGSTLSAPGTGSTVYLNFSGLANGSYPYSIGFVTGYGATPASGTAIVSGANVTQIVKFVAFVGTTAAVNFEEAGLVSNTTWSVVVANVGALSSNQPVITFALPANATPGWNYTPSTVIGYTNTGPGDVVTDGATPATVSIVYTGVILTTYAVTFASTGLPTSDSWSVDLANFTLTSTAANITFYEENGTYGFTLTVPSGVVPPASAGQVAVLAAATVVSVPLTAPQNAFAMTFDESGLPTGSAWNVTVNGFGIQSLTTSLTFEMPNGTYNWTVSTIGGWIATTLSGTILVNGTTTPTKIKFVQYTYDVTFFEGGLAAGASWGVTVAGTAWTGSTYYIVVPLPNGTFAFSVPPITDYLATPGSGNVTVAAAPQTQVIIFGPIPTEYTVTFTETGLPTGASWTVYFGTQAPVTTTASSVSFQATNGSWAYGIGAPSGQSATPNAGHATVNGNNVPVSITFSPVSVSTTNQNFLGTLAYALIGLFVVLTVIFLALALYWRGRKPPAAAPPQSWEATSTTPTTTESNEGQTPPST